MGLFRDKPFHLLSAAVTAVLATVYAVEYLLGYPPCPLCLYQRIPWFFLLIISLLGWRVQTRTGHPPNLILGLLLAIILVSIGLAGHHTGVEFRWWDGPKNCGGVGAISDIAELKKKLLETPPIRCDQPDFTFLGASLALWNLIGSAILALAILLRLTLKPDRR